MEVTPSQDLFELLRSGSRLPSAPAVAMRVLELSRSADVSLGELAETISSDPALSARILRFVNSPMAGGPRQISSLNQAVCLIGLRGVQMITLPFSLVSLDAETSCKSFDHNRFWSRSLACAVAASTIAQKTKKHSTDEAFVTGLLSRIGQLVLTCGIPDKYEQVLQRAADQPCELLAVEREIIGATHVEIGARLLEEWQLPESIWRTIGHYHNVGAADGAEGASTLARILYTADLAASIICERPEHTAEKIEQVLCAANGLLGIDPEAWADVFDIIAQNWGQYGPLLAVKTGDVQSFSAIQAEAQALLTEISLAAQLENQPS